MISIDLKRLKRIGQTYGERSFGEIIKFAHGDESFVGAWGDRFGRRNDDLFIVLNLCLAQYANKVIDYLRLQHVGWCPLEV